MPLSRAVHLFYCTLGILNLQLIHPKCDGKIDRLSTFGLLLEIRFGQAALFSGQNNLTLATTVQVFQSLTGSSVPCQITTNFSIFSDELHCFFVVQFLRVIDILCLVRKTNAHPEVSQKRCLTMDGNSYAQSQLIRTMNRIYACAVELHRIEWKTP